MNDVEGTVRRFNGERLGNLMILLFRSNNIHEATSEAEVSGYYKDIMLNREASQNVF